MPRQTCVVTLLLLFSFLSARAEGREAFWVEEVEGIRVAHCDGEPSEWGKAYGETFREELQDLFHKYFLAGASEQEVAQARQASAVMETHVPEAYKAELRAIAEGCGLAYEDLVVAQCYADLLQMMGCSTFVALGERSADGKPIFGRNLDYPARGLLQDRHVVTVYHLPEGRAVLAVGFPGVLGAITGMNDRGLSLAVMNVFGYSPTPDGMPYLYLFRRILETCETVDEGIEVVRATKRTTPNNLMLCDPEGAAVVEFSPAAVEVRRPEEDRIWSTNHFESKGLSKGRTCERYDFLRANLSGAVDVEAAKRLLAGVHQGEMTLQSIVLRPATRELWFAGGRLPATGGEYRRVDARALFAPR